MKTLSDAIRDSLVIALLPNRSRQQHGKRAALAILCASLLALTACGSGGGGTSTFLKLRRLICNGTKVTRPAIVSMSRLAPL